MIRILSPLLILLAVTACTSPAVTPYAEVTKNYSCHEIKVELKYLDALEKNVRASEKNSPAVFDVGMAAINLGMHAMERDGHFTQQGQAEAQLDKIKENRKYMEARKNEKCRS